MSVRLVRSVISPRTLYRNFDSFQVIDGSSYMPATGKNGRKEYEKQRIRDAIFFDLDVCSRAKNDQNNLPHMMPSENLFKEYVTSQGIDLTKPLVVYDTIGMFSAARVWFMFKSFGVDNVSVLDGGLPFWKSLGLPTETGPGKSDLNSVNPDPNLNSKVTLQKIDNILQVNGMKEAIEDKKLIIDARSAERFNGEVDEPRPGLKRGHIPTSINIPFQSLLQDLGNFKEPTGDLAFDDLDLKTMVKNNQDLIFTCGSGVTACVTMLYFVEFHGVEFTRCKLYDGSFAEWGDPKNNLPIETKKT